MTLAPTPGQTVGPFFHYALPYAGDRELVAPGTPGALLLHGTVRDGSGAGLQDALVEVWQAGPDGEVLRRPGSLRRDGHVFTGWGRASTDRTGRYAFTTLRPGAVDGALPFFALTVFARGLLDRLFTRAYLPLEPGATDAVLTAAGERAGTLVCTEDELGLRFDITLQASATTGATAGATTDGAAGEETVFLTYPGHSQA